MLGLPLAVVIIPFNESVPVPEYKTEKVPRCNECGSFPSPFSDYSGISFRCVICKSGSPLIVQDSPCFRHPPTVDFIVGSGEQKSTSISPTIHVQEAQGGVMRKT